MVRSVSTHVAHNSQRGVGGKVKVAESDGIVISDKGNIRETVNLLFRA
jgi:hypothetical protein